MENYIQDAITELYRCFDIINKEKFEDKLPRPIITIQFDKKAMGHCSVKRIWARTGATEEELSDENDFYEVMIASNFLNREVVEIVHTLVHECVHLYNAAVIGKNDCTGAKHGKRFKNVCEMVGLDCGDKHPKYGWGLTELTPELKTWIEEVVKPDPDKFCYFCYIPQKEKKTEETEKKTFVAWVCPGCGREAKFEDGLENVVCGDCNMPFELKPKGKRGRKAKSDED